MLSAIELCIYDYKVVWLNSKNYLYSLDSLKANMVIYWSTDTVPCCSFHLDTCNFQRLNLWYVNFVKFYFFLNKQKTTMQIDAFPEWVSIVVSKEDWIACYINYCGEEIFHSVWNTNIYASTSMGHRTFCFKLAEIYQSRSMVSCVLSF